MTPQQSNEAFYGKLTEEDKDYIIFTQRQDIDALEAERTKTNQHNNMEKLTDPKEVSRNYKQAYLAAAQASSMCEILRKENEHLKHSVKILEEWNERMKNGFFGVEDELHKQIEQLKHD